MADNRPLIVVDPDCRKRGLDPRELTGEQLEAAGVMRQPVLSAIRAKCIDCCGGMLSEVRDCTITSCALWPFRFNHNPFRVGREMSAEERAAAGERLKKARAAMSASLVTVGDDGLRRGADPRELTTAGRPLRGGVDRNILA